MKKEMIIGVKALSVFILLSVMLSLVSAGVGIKWDQQSKLVEQGTKTCLTYSVYNPWPKDSYVKIEVSGDVESIIKSQESSSKLIPANTPSNSSIPIDFCFSVPFVYEDQRDCLVGDFFCKQECSGPIKNYDGEILVSEAGSDVSSGGGSGGSSTSVSVSAPLSIRVQCIAHPRDFTLLYALIFVICVILIAYFIIKRNSKPKVERDKEKLRRLKEQIRRESKKK